MDSIKAVFHTSIGSELEIDNLNAYFGAIGLGILNVSGDAKEMHVTVDQPITSSQTTPVVDQFLVGIVRGAFAKIFSHDYSVKNLSYNDAKIKLDLVWKQKILPS